ncbi:MAG: hypothetical protein K9G67_02540 [Bacteroidales bacterium]|nr:hypothetical protein [Bacteroidales bacterium]MCF8350049.1 hypothetical protein [Bacteroidales bacterium]MCF8375205.1 hypothetical protein [Bacteroidales bacterium]MCF8400229.1 hypothetical protein [Bacteroidales bacterium]
MKTNTVIIALFFLAIGVSAQQTDSLQGSYKNMAELLLSSDNKLTIGGYGEVHFNKEVDHEFRHNSHLDVHRIVLLFGYNFSDKTKFISEIEFEHVKEVYVEQAFLQHKINNYINLRAGLLLTPMGIINEYHEPTTFNGVERPFVDKYIVPTTWREIGAGISGNVFPARLKYQLYLVNGFKSYDDKAFLNGKYGFRKARQKGAESFMSSPDITGKIEYYGVSGLNIGVSLYSGKTESALYENINDGSTSAINTADSSIVGLTMLGLDGRYSIAGFQIRGQYYYAWISNTLEYNHFTASEQTLNDLGSSMIGYYLEAGYNLLKNTESTASSLIPFIRYERFNTQNTVEQGLSGMDIYNNTAITSGLSWEMAPGAVFKADMQWIQSRQDDQPDKMLNLGFGVMF